MISQRPTSEAPQISLSERMVENEVKWENLQRNRQYIDFVNACISNELEVLREKE